MGTALVIDTTGEVTELDLGAPEDSHLHLLQTAARCQTITVVRVTDRIDMWLDDEGLYTQQRNDAATALGRFYGLTWQSYYGPVVLCGADAEGNSINLTDHQVAALLTTLHDALVL